MKGSGALMTGNRRAEVSALNVRAGRQRGDLSLGHHPDLRDLRSVLRAHGRVDDRREGVVDRAFARLRLEGDRRVVVVRRHVQPKLMPDDGEERDRGGEASPAEEEGLGAARLGTTRLGAARLGTTRFQRRYVHHGRFRENLCASRIVESRGGLLVGVRRQLADELGGQAQGADVFATRAAVRQVLLDEGVILSGEVALFSRKAVFQKAFLEDVQAQELLDADAARAHRIDRVRIWGEGFVVHGRRVSRFSCLGRTQTTPAVRSSAARALSPLWMR